MQKEIVLANPSTAINILGVNLQGLESTNNLVTPSVDLPWLQDTAVVDAWGLWGVTWRDVIILDRDNLRVEVYNLTSNDLNVPAKYDELKALLLSVAGE